jgi:hypothetical protein
MRLSPNSSTILMMMKGTGDKQIQKFKSSLSSSTSSSLLVDEHQQIKSRGFKFVSVPFNGTRFLAKSTEQLNNSPTSILKKNFVQKYTPCSSKNDADACACYVDSTDIARRISLVLLSSSSTFVD